MKKGFVIVVVKFGRILEADVDWGQAMNPLE